MNTEQRYRGLIKYQFIKGLGRKFPNREEFNRLDKLSIDGFVEDEDGLIDEGLFSLSDDEYSVFLDLISAFFPAGDYALYGYAFLDSDYDDWFRSVLDVHLLKGRRYSGDDRIFEPLYVDISDLSEEGIIEAALKGEYSLLSGIFSGILVFHRRQNHRELMSGGFWARQADLDMEDPLRWEINIPHLLKHCTRVVRFECPGMHDYPVIYGNDLNIFELIGKIGRIAAEYGAEVVPVKPGKAFAEWEYM